MTKKVKTALDRVRLELLQEGKRKDDEIYNSEGRKEKKYEAHSIRTKILYFPYLGKMRYTRRRYRKDGKFHYLLDKKLGFKRRQRFDDEVVEIILDKLKQKLNHKEITKDLEKIGVKMHCTLVGRILKRTPVKQGREKKD